MLQGAKPPKPTTTTSTTQPGYATAGGSDSNYFNPGLAAAYGQQTKTRSGTPISSPSGGPLPPSTLAGGATPAPGSWASGLASNIVNYARGVPAQQQNTAAQQAQAAMDAWLQQNAASQAALGSLYDQQKGLLDAQGTLADQHRQAEQDFLRKQYEAQQALLGNQQYRDIDLGREQARQRAEAANALFLLQQTGYTDTNSYLNQQGQLAGSARDLAMQYYQNVLNNTVTGTNQAWQQGNRAAQSGVTNTGAYTSAGYGNTLNDLLNKKDLGIKTANDAYGYNAGQAQQQYASTAAALEDQRKKNKLSYDKNYLDLQGAQNEYNHTNKVLDSMANDYGVQRQQAADAVNRGLANLGYDYASMVNQLEQAKRDKDIAKVTAIQNLMNQAAGIGFSSTGGLGGSGGGAGSTGTPSAAGYTVPGSGFSSYGTTTNRGTSGSHRI